MQQTWVQSLGWEDPLEKETATHSSILAWRIPWTEEPGGLQSTGSQRVGRDLATKQQLQYFVTAALENEYGRKKCSISVETAEAWQEGRYVI